MVKLVSIISLEVLGFGLILADPKNLINLLPKEIHEKGRSIFKKAATVRFFILFLLVFGLGGSMFGIEIYQKEKRLNVLEQKFISMKTKV